MRFEKHGVHFRFFESLRWSFPILKTCRLFFTIRTSAMRTPIANLYFGSVSFITSIRRQGDQAAG